MCRKCIIADMLGRKRPQHPITRCRVKKPKAPSAPKSRK